MKRVLCCIGTRPEAIKMAPVVRALKQCAEIETRVLATAQHREMLDQVLRVFEIHSDIDLNVMRPNQALTTLTGRLLLDLDRVLLAEKPDAVLAQGDTTTVMAVALACFYHGIPFGHIEAGLRTWDVQNPFPEEMNRVLAGRLATWHFAPTESSRNNLLREGIAEESIFVTGNTVIDALLNVVNNPMPLPYVPDPSKRLILVTAHRRENFGHRFAEICRAIRHLADQRRDIEFLYPVHPNPNIRDVATTMLGGQPSIHLCEPLDYLTFVSAMKMAYFILSDSGGVQEEAPAIGKPVLVLRTETERPEAINEGVVSLIGTDFDTIVRECENLLDNPNAYRKMARGISPYGDGHASERILQILRRHLITDV